jgi:L-threonylcarbamoyladenylate synthase
MCLTSNFPTFSLSSLIFAAMNDFTHDVDQCLEVLKKGGVILYPTDTVWGLGCDASNAAAVGKVFAIKKRAESKSLIVLLADERDLLRYVVAPDPEIFNYLDAVTKPTTVIYQGVVGLADEVMNADGSVGIRIVKEDFCRHLIKRFRKPIVSTSANISGEPTPRIFAEISNAVKEAVDYTVQWRQGDNVIKEPSAVIKWSNGKVDIIRK